MMSSDQQFFLKWNDFQTNMVTSFRHLRDEKSFTDVTLACEGQTCKAHKMVLSACSPYFKALLEENPSKHPIIILKDVSYIHLQAILEFMYAGEVNVSQEQLPAFLKTADRLKVKGLAETPSIKREEEVKVEIEIKQEDDEIKQEKKAINQEDEEIKQNEEEIKQEEKEEETKLENEIQVEMENALKMEYKLEKENKLEMEIMTILNQ